MANEVKIILTLEDQQFVKQIRSSFGEAKKFTDATKAATGSIADLTTRVNQARTALEKAAPGSREYENALKRLQVVSEHSTKAQSEFSNKLRGNVKPGVDQASFALMNMNRIASDSAYGIQGIANNIDPFVESVSRAIKASGGIKGAFSAIATSLAGPMGLMTVISLASSALTWWSMSNRGAKKDVDEHREAVDKLKDSYNAMTRAQLQDELSKAKSEFNKLPVFVRYEQNFDRETGKVSFQPRKNLIPTAKDMDDNIKYLERQIFLLGDKNNVEKELQQNEARLSSLNRNNISLYKDVGNTYDEIKTKLEGWIDADKKVLDTYSDKNKKTLIEIQSDELKLHQLKFEWGNEDLNTYRLYLQNKLNAIKTSNAEELQLAITLREELNKINGVDVSTIKAAGIDSNVAGPGLLDSIKWGQGAINVQGPLKEVNVPAKSATKATKGLSDEANIAKSAFQELGSSIADAMFGAKITIGQVLSEIGKLITKMILFKTIEAGINAIFPGVGTVGTVATQAVPHFASGGIVGDAMPVMAHKKELILNGGQQWNLFKMLNDNNFLSSKFSARPNQVQTIRLDGNIRANQTEFYIEFKRLEQRMDKYMRVLDFGRS